MTREIWQTIDRDNRYMVSNLGRVKSFVRSKKGCDGKIVCGEKTVKGYIRFRIGKIRILGHRLVAVAFLENKENKLQVNHINGIKGDNNLSNLEWVTQSENMLHAISTGLLKSVSGEKVNTAKLKEWQVRAILENFDKERTVLLGSVLGVSSENIRSIINRKIWKNVNMGTMDDA